MVSNSWNKMSGFKKKGKTHTNQFVSHIIDEEAHFMEEDGEAHRDRSHVRTWVYEPPC